MLERVISVAATLAAPMVGLALRGTRRNRLLSRIETYSALSESVAKFDEAAASDLRKLIKEMIESLVVVERRSMHKRLDAGMGIVVILLMLPAIALAYWAWSQTLWVKWPLLVVAAIWIWADVAGNVSSVWKPSEEADFGRDRGAQASHDTA